jgi:hypothetical protein
MEMAKTGEIIIPKDGIPVGSNHAVTTSLAFYFSNK